MAGCFKNTPALEQPQHSSEPVRSSPRCLVISEWSSARCQRALRHLSVRVLGMLPAKLCLQRRELAAALDVAGTACRRCRLCLPFRYLMGSGGLFQGTFQVLSQPREGRWGWLVPHCCHPCGQAALQSTGQGHLGRAARGQTHGLMSALRPCSARSGFTFTPQMQRQVQRACLDTQSEPLGAHPRALQRPHWCRRQRPCPWPPPRSLCLCFAKVTQTQRSPGWAVLVQPPPGLPRWGCRSRLLAVHDPFAQARKSQPSGLARLQV